MADEAVEEARNNLVPSVAEVAHQNQQLLILSLREGGREAGREGGREGGIAYPIAGYFQGVYILPISKLL